MAQALDVKRQMIAVPISSTGFSKLWVQIFGNSSYELVSPLIDSLLCELPQIAPPEEIKHLIQFKSFEQMVMETLKTNLRPPSTKRNRQVTFEKTVRSIQRLSATSEHDCRWITKQYFELIPKILPFISVKISEDKNTFSFNFPFLRKPLLILKHIPSEFDFERYKLYIIGGLLTRPQIRVGSNLDKSIIVSIH